MSESHSSRLALLEFGLSPVPEPIGTYRYFPAQPFSVPRSIPIYNIHRVSPISSRILVFDRLTEFAWVEVMDEDVVIGQVPPETKIVH